MTFITGASSGIGRSLAKRIAATGEPVTVTARRKDLLDTLVQEIEQAGEGVGHPCDVTDRAAVRERCARRRASSARSTTLIANAGGAIGDDGLGTKFDAATSPR